MDNPNEPKVPAAVIPPVETPPAAVIPPENVVTVPVVVVTPEMVLADPGLSQSDYTKARNDPKFLEQLVLEKNTPKVAEPVKVKPAEEAPPTEPEAKKKGGFQRKIDKLTDRNYALQAELDRSKKALEVKVAAAPVAPVAPEVPPAEVKKPILSDFGSFEEFTEAMVEYRANQIVEKRFAEQEAEANQLLAAHRQAREEQQQAETTVMRNQAWRKQVEVSRQQHPDFDEIVFESDAQLTEAMEHAIFSSPQGSELAYYLGQHPEEIERIAQLSPLNTIMELGAIVKGLVPKGTSNGKGSAAAATAPAAENVPAKPGEPASPVKPGEPAVSQAPEPPAFQTNGNSGKLVKDYAYYAKAPLREYLEARNSGQLR